MSCVIDVQRAVDSDQLPSDRDIRGWVEAALQSYPAESELVIRIVGEQESRTLNREYRSKGKPTNVLSFPFEAPAVVESALLGDLVICAPVVAQEARDQGKSLQAHWAHMVVHGVLHLLGYDHLNDEQAREMEDLEKVILAKQGLPDPYA